MTIHGVVLDARNPAGRPPVTSLAPFRIARLTAFADEAVYAYARELRAAGIQIAAVFTLEVIGTRPAETKAAEIARNLEMDYVILGNEPDALYNVNPDTGQPYDSPASDLMHEAAYGRWASQVARGVLSVQPDVTLCVAGMVSGQPWAARRYVDALRREGIRPHALDLHLYATHSSELAVKVAGYEAQHLGLGFCMFEWHETEPNDLPAMVAQIEACGIMAATYHAWHETDIPGLHDAQGLATAAYGALVRSLQPTEVAMPEYEYIEGHDFQRFAREHGLGAPLTAEVGIRDTTVQLAPEGLLIFIDGKSVILPGATMNPTPTPPLPPPSLVTGLDVSNHQPRDLSALISQFRPEHVVVKLYQRVEVAGGRAHALAQIESARAAGCTIAAYVWLYRDVPVANQIRDAVDLADEAALVLPMLWVDFEPYLSNSNLPTLAQLGQACEEADRRNVRVGIYTGRWVWQLIGNPTTELRQRPLWTADYSFGRPAIEEVPLYGGWTREQVWGHQWTSDPVDRNAFRGEATRA